VIVRISTEGQYELPDDLHDELNAIDNRVVEAIAADDEARYTQAFGELLAFIRERGTEIAGDDLRESELIVPPPDLSLAEAEQEFSGDGLLPD